MLCLGVETDVSCQAKDPQQLIDAVRQQNALAFLAHPIEQGTRLFSDTYPWRNWEVTGYCGIELWNYLSSFRGFTTSYLRAILVAVLPHCFTVGPLPAMLQKWDELMQDRPIVALGGTDVHAVVLRRGPISRPLHDLRGVRPRAEYPCTDQGPLPWSGGRGRLRLFAMRMCGTIVSWSWMDCGRGTAGSGTTWSVLRRAFASGRSWKRGPWPKKTVAIMGDTVTLPAGRCLRLQVRAPGQAQIRLLRNGRVIAQGHADAISYDVRDPSVYRVEVWKHRWGKLRGWIFSNPIYVRRAEDE